MVGGKLRLHRRKRCLIDQGRLLAFMDLALVDEPSRVDRVGQQAVEMPAAERPAARLAAGTIDPHRHQDALLVELRLQRAHRAEFEVALRTASGSAPHAPRPTCSARFSTR